MSHYKKILNSTSIIRVADGAFIPENPLLNEWRDYVTWENAGNVPDEPDPLPAPTPEQIEHDQLKNMVKVQELLNLVPANVNAWAAANITNVAQARDVITTIILTLLLIRSKLKQ